MARVKSKNAGAKEGFETADRLHSAAIHLLRRLRVRDRESGVGPAQLSALSVLVFGGPRSLGELADAEQVRPPTMSRIVAGLERAGLVKRRKTEDGRRVRLEASARGTKDPARGALAASGVSGKGTLRAFRERAEAVGPACGADATSDSKSIGAWRTDRDTPDFRIAA